MAKPDWYFDEAKHAVYDAAGTEYRLKPKQFDLMMLLGTSPEISKDTAIDALWDGNFDTGEKGLHQTVWQLRKQFESIAPDLITTKPRRGYVLNVTLSPLMPDEEAEANDSGVKEDVPAKRPMSFFRRHEKWIKGAAIIGLIALWIARSLGKGG